MEKIEVPTFLKWAGGKQQLLSQFSERFPVKIDHYVEPFLGGGAVLFYILKFKRPKTAKAFDSNAELINTYLQVKNNIGRLIKQLTISEQEHNSASNPIDYYYRRRRDFNSIIHSRTHLKSHALKKAALFMYLNKTCFNGLYRVNSKGEFNVPFNGSRKIRLFNPAILYEASDLLQNVTLEKEDFRNIRFRKNETVYFDPPYWSEPGKNGFTSYTNPDFDKRTQEELSNIFRKLSQRGCKLILSNSNTSYVIRLYDHPSFEKKEILARRMINCNGDGRHPIKEVLITANL